MIRRLALSLAVATTTVHAAIHVVDKWTMNWGFCKGDPPRRSQLEPIRAAVGDSVEFKFSTGGDMAGHDVYEYPDEESWEACDQARAVQVASGAQGGNCSTDYAFDCIRDSAGFRQELAAPRDHYYACSGNHCTGGLKVKVLVSSKRDPLPWGPREIEVPNWTDDYGYCAEPFAEVHRPNGLNTIIAHEGDTLVFKYSAKHNVFIADDHGAYTSCDKTRMGMVGDYAAGGGCADDYSLATDGGDGCIAKSEGFRYKLSFDDPRAIVSAEGSYAQLYVLCQVHDHCANGQKVIVTILPRQEPPLPIPRGVTGEPSGSLPSANSLTKRERNFLAFILIVTPALLAALLLLYRKIGRMRSGIENIGIPLSLGPDSAGGAADAFDVGAMEEESDDDQEASV